ARAGPSPMAPNHASVRGAQPMARQAHIPRPDTGAMRSVQAPRHSYPEAEEPAPRGKGLKRALAVILCLAALGAGGWYANKNRESLLQIAYSVAARLPSGLFETTPGGSVAGGGNLDHSPLQGF